MLLFPFPSDIRFPFPDMNDTGSFVLHCEQVGFIAGVFPFVWAGFEFWKRIDVQQRCGVCQGSGLVYENASGKSLSVPRKCYACGGFLPWAGWRRFWLSNLDIGNGGVLQRPAADYEALSEAAKRRRAGREGGREGGGEGGE